MSQEVVKQKFYSTIIPALNEERTIAPVIKVFRDHSLCSEVIVVSDGSTDKTAEAAHLAGAKVIQLSPNRGKGEALEAGIKESREEVLFFCDADLKGLREEVLSEMAVPVLADKYDMYIGISARSIYWLNRILHFFPLISGQRVITKKLWYEVPVEYRSKFGIETSLNYYSRKLNKKTKFKLFYGITQVKKETKYGFWRGFWGRLRMIAQVIIISVRLYIIDWTLYKLGKLFLKDETLQGL